jgi:hypothetical protein
MRGFISVASAVPAVGLFTEYVHTVISADFVQVSLRFWPVFFTGTGKNVGCRGCRDAGNAFGGEVYGE